MIIPFNGKQPKIAQGVFIAPTAVIIGDVTIEAGASVWFNTVIRGDMAPIVIGANTNIQDNCTLHVDPDCLLTVGAGVTVGHSAVVHGCTVENHVLIGMNATLMNCCLIRSGSVVAAGAVVTENHVVGPFQLVAGMPAKVKKDLPPAIMDEHKISAGHYADLARIYGQMTG